MKFDLKGWLKRMFTGAQTPPEPEEPYYEKPTVVVKINENDEISVCIKQGQEKLSIEYLQAHLKTVTASNISLHISSYENELHIDSNMAGIGTEQEYLQEQLRSINLLADNILIKCETWARQNGYDFKSIDKRPPKPDSPETSP